MTISWKKNMTVEQRVYFHRHSRSCRAVENTFAIFTVRWRILLTSIKPTVENTEKCVLVFLALHHYLRQTNNALCTPAGFIDSESSDGALILSSWRSDIPKNSISPSRRTQMSLRRLQDNLKRSRRLPTKRLEKMSDLRRLEESDLRHLKDVEFMTS